MPGKQQQELRSHRYSLEPKSWLHRAGFPFFFEQTNYSFRLTVERLDDKYEWDKGYNTVDIAIRFENNDFTWRTLALPNLAVGDKARLDVDDAYVAHPGQTAIVIPTRSEGRDQWSDYRGIPYDWLTLYSYRVRTQESLWVSIAAVLFGVASLSAATLVPICIASTRDPSVVNVSNNILVSATETPLPTATLTPEPTPTAEAP